SAVTTALVLSGLPTDRFVFEGFLPRSGRARTDRLAALASEPRTIVLFESPRRLVATLGDMNAALGERRVVVCRALTKLHQEVLRGSFLSLVNDLGGRELKGEITLVVEGGSADGAVSGRIEDAVAIARRDMKEGARRREAAKHAARETGLSA